MGFVIILKYHILSWSKWEGVALYGIRYQSLIVTVAQIRYNPATNHPTLAGLSGLAGDDDDDADDDDDIMTI